VLGGFGVDGGLNGPGEPANSWKVGEALARVPASGVGADLWERHGDLLHLIDALRPDHVVIPVDWARLAPALDSLDAATVAHYRSLLTELRHRSIAIELRLSDGCVPAALGQEFWLLPGAPEQFATFVAMAADAFGDLVDRWETIHDPVRWIVEGYLCGSHPPFRRLAIDDACSALDNLLTAHVLGASALLASGVPATAISLGLSPMVGDLDRAIALAMRAAADGADAEAIGQRITEARHLGRRNPLGVLVGALNPLGLRAHRRWPARPVPRRFLEALGSASRAHDGVSISVVLDPVPFQFFAFGSAWAIPRRARHGSLPTLFDPEAGRGSLIESVAVATKHNTLRRGQSTSERIDLLATRCELAERRGPLRYTYDGILDGYRHGTFVYRTGLFSVDRSRGTRGVTWSATDATGHDAAGAFARLAAHLRATR
jgi:Glycosyl hydrolase family 1